MKEKLIYEVFSDTPVKEAFKIAEGLKNGSL